MKKLVSTLLAASLGFCSVNASASLPGGGYSFNFMGLNPNPNLQLAADVINSVKLSFKELNDKLRQKYACVARTGEQSELWVFSELSEIGKEFVNLRREISALEGILGSDYHVIDRRSLERIESKIKNLQEKLNRVPARKPTSEDVRAGKCFNCGQVY